jgi:hypothetical protein
MLKDVELFTFLGEGGSVMEMNSSKGNWFLIECSWQMGADAEAIQRFREVYKYLLPLASTDDPKVRQVAIERAAKEDPLLLNVVPDSLKSLNLIGRRKFVIICQILNDKSNKWLQKLSKMISLEAPISVEIFPATYVHDLEAILPK